MAETAVFEPGGYRYVRGPFQYSGGVAAQPGYDEQWFTSVDTPDIARLEQTEETRLLETRRFRWDCGCDLDRVLPALGTWRDKPEELFQGQEEITIQCPRCAAKFAVTRDMI